MVCTFSIADSYLSILHLCYRYDPSADIHGDTDTEQDRIIFIKSVAEFMVRKINIKCMRPTLRIFLFPFTRPVWVGR